MLERIFRRLFDLRAGEGPLAAKAFAALFLTIGGHTVLETARDALFLSKLPASQLNVVYVILAGLTFVVAAASTWLAGRFGRRNALVCSLLVAAFVTTALHSLTPTPSMALGLYVFSGLVGAVLTPQFWLLAGRMFTVSQGRRLFGPVASGGVLGGVAGAGLAAIVVNAAPVTSLLVVAAALFLVTALIVTTIATDDEPSMTPKSVAANDESLRGLFRHNPFLGRIALLVALSTSAVLVVDYLFKSTAARAIPAAELGSFFARFYAAMNGVSLVVQLLLATRLLRRLGVVGAIAVMPLLLTIGGTGVVAIGGTIVTALVAKTVDGGLRHSLNRIGTELLYLPLPTAARERGKSLVDGVVSRTAQAATAGLLLLLATRGIATPRVLGAMIGGASFAWLATALFSRSRYLDLFREALRGGRIAASSGDDDLDLASAELLVEAMASRDPITVVAAMNVLSQKQRGRIIPALVLYHDAEPVLVRALEIFADSTRTDWIPLGERLLSDPRETVRIAALRALARHDVASAVERAVDDGSPRVQGYAAIHMAMRGDGADLLTHPRVASVMTAPGEAGVAARVGVLAAIVDAPTPRATSVLFAIADQADTMRAPDAPAMLADAMGSIADPRFVPTLVARLAVRAGRDAVRTALVKLGDVAFDALVRALRDASTDARIRLHVPRSLSRFGNQRASDVLVDQLERETSGLVRYKVLRGLGQVVSSGARVDRARVEREARRNLDEHLRLLGLRVALSGPRQPGVASPADLLTGLLDDKLAQALERVFRLLKMVHPREDLHRLHIVARSGDKRARANAIEYLDALFSKVEQQSLRDSLRLVLDDLDDVERVARAGGATVPESAAAAVAILVDDRDDVVATLAAHRALSLGAASLAEAVGRARERRPALAAMDAQWFGRLEEASGA